MRHILSVLSLSIITFHIHNYFGAFMKLVQGTLAIALSTVLVACGGGGSSGYYDNNNSGNNGGGTTQPPAVDLVAAKAQLDVLKREGQYLFGNYDPNDADAQKGYIDHALDTFTQGPLQLALDARKAFEQNPNAFLTFDKCVAEGIYSNTKCHVLIDDAHIKSVLNSINKDKYTDWDFDVVDQDIAGLKVDNEQVDRFTGKTIIVIFDNQNADKRYNDIWVSGVFAYPFKQSWGLEQVDQLRVVSMSTDNSEYNITLTYDDQTEETKGAVSIYKDPTSSDGELYTLQNNSGFEVLINDNPNTPNVEPVTFTINSVPGDATAFSTYRVNKDLIHSLDLKNVTAINGQRIENETPNTNVQSLTGSMKLSGLDIFTFKNSKTAKTLNFEHSFDEFTFKGQSIKNGTKVTTTLTQPSGLSY